MLVRTTVLLALPAVVLAGTCNINSGLAGECISTSTCSDRGGKSEANHCPGPTDIQCCTYGPCTNNSVDGTCQPTSTCVGKTTTANLCPGPADIQCCTSKSDTPPSNPPPSSGCNNGAPPKVNSATVSLIKEFEGFVPAPSPDPIGLPTVGYGHLCKTTGCAEVTYTFPLTSSTAASLLQDDLKSFEDCIAGDIDKSVKLNDNQYGALCSWAFNVGCGNVGSSTLIKKLNAGEDPDTVAAEELPKWNKAGGGVLSGLTRRRAAEVALFKTASSTGALPPC